MIFFGESRTSTETVILFSFEVHRDSSFSKDVVKFSKHGSGQAVSDDLCGLIVLHYFDVSQIHIFLYSIDVREQANGPVWGFLCSQAQFFKEFNDIILYYSKRPDFSPLLGICSTI